MTVKHTPVGGGNDNICDPVRVANAKLIAAAPGLLQACKRFVAKVESGKAQSKEIYAEMKAAIAKAEGLPVETKIYAIYTDEAGAFPILNGSKVKDDAGQEYTFISFDQKEGNVTVKDASGKVRTTSAPTFNIHFESEEVA